MHAAVAFGWLVPLAFPACNRSGNGLGDNGGGGIPVSDASGFDTGVGPGNDSGGPGKPDGSGVTDGGAQDGADASDGSPYPYLDSSFDAPSNHPDGGHGGPPDGGFDPECQTPLGWWASPGATFDSNVTPGTFAAQTNPLLAGPNAHPFSLADYQGDASSWMLRASATSTNGNQVQYFPVQYPVTDGLLSLGTTGFASGSPGAGWLQVVDAASTTVWIQLDQISVSASYGDAFCGSLVGGTMTAVIDGASGGTAITTSSGKTTIGALLGAQNSTQPAGWTMSLSFTAAKTQVTFK